MYYTKDIESFGTGLKRIAEACEEDGVKYEFQLRAYGFAVIFYRRPAHDDANNGANDANNGTNDANRATDETNTDDELKILIAIKTNPSISATELTNLVNKSRRTVQRKIEALKQQGLIERIGPTNGGVWQITIKGEESMRGL